MDVRCDQCGTEYEFDDERVAREPVTVKCANCGFIFKIRAPAASESPRFGAPTTGPGKKSSAWMVRQPNGNIFTFKELTTLQKWIVERKVTRDDEISKSGETWKRLGNIAELASFFQAVDAQVTPSPPPAAAPAPAPYPTAGPQPYMAGYPGSMPQGGSMPGMAPMGAMPPMAGYPGAPYPYPAGYPMQPGYPYPAPPGMPPTTGPYPVDPNSVAVAGTPPAGAFPSPGAISIHGPGAPAGPRVSTGPVNAPPNTIDEEDLDDDDPVLRWQRRRRMTTMAVGLVLVVGLAGGGVLVMAPEEVQAAIARAKAALGMGRPPAALAAVEEARKAWMRSGYPDLVIAQQKADEALKLAPGWGEALAMKSLACTFNGLGRSEEKAELAAQLNKLKGSKEGLDGADGRAVREALEKVQASEVELFKAAFENAKAALQAAPHDVLPNVSVAAYYAARQVPKEAVTYLERARAAAPQGHPVMSIVAVELKALEAPTRDEAIKELTEIIKATPEALVARYRLAAWLLAAGRHADAAAEAEALLKENPEHVRAKAIKAAAVPPVEEKPKPAPTPPPAEKTRAGAEAQGGDDEEKPKGGGGYDRTLAQADKLRERGKCGKAVNLYLRASELEPERAEPHVGLGWCFIDQEKNGAAVGEFERAVQLNSSYGEAYLGLGEVYKFRGDKQNAIKNYQKYLSLLPDGPDADVARNAIESLK